MLKAEIALQVQQILQIANEAIAVARLENKERKLANPVSLNGKPYYQLPNGKLTDQNPNK